MNMITSAELRAVLSYDPETGVFTRGGERAGTLNKHTGYRQIRVNGKIYLEHRLAWLWLNGDWPTREIDHINGNSADNRAANIREADSTQNKINVGLRSSNKSGVTGVSFDKNKNRWCAHITAYGRRHCLGDYIEFGEAVRARRAAEIRHHGEFTHQDRTSEPARL